MKMPNFKNIDYKQLGIDHGEKVVIALIALMIGGVLYGSNWKGTDKSPIAMKDQADKTNKEIDERPWDEQREKRMAGLGQGNELAEKVATLLTPVSVSGFSIESFYPPLHPDKALISRPRWLPVQHLLADDLVAEISLRAGTPRIDDGNFVRKPTKDKDAKKGRRERKRQREAKEAKKEKEKEKEKKEETDDNIPDDLKPKSPVGDAQGGGFGGMGLGGRIGGGGRNRSADKRASRQKAMDEEAAATPRFASKPVGRGYHFVAVRGIFPLRDQTNELARAMGLPSTQKNIQNMVQFHDFKLERQTRVNRPGTDPWSGPWEAVDRDAVIDLLENEVEGYAPETVLDGLIDGHIAMPYPDRVVGQWERFATHPDIKEFTLSDDEVQKQVEYEFKLLEKLKAEDQQGKAPPDKGGFMAVTRNMRGISARAHSTQAGDERSPQEKILEEYKAGGDKDQMNEQMEEFVRTRATPIDHYLLFRYLDMKVEPGKTYRYRVKLVVANPFKERRIEEVTDPSIIEGEWRDTEYSEPTPPVTVQDNSQFYVKRVDWRPGRTSLPSANMDVFQWFPETGTVVNKELSVQLGQILGGRKTAEVLRPAENIFDTESVLFSSRDALVDVSPGFSFDQNLHKDILDELKNIPSVKRTGVSAPEEAIVVDDNGDLHMVDGMDQKADYDRTKTRYELQNKAFDALRKPAGSDDDVLGTHHHRGNKKDRTDPRRDSFGRGRKGRSGMGGSKGGDGG